ncbi:hypothetical protein EOD42_16680 [Rhodovarius crocodyli]|uniref:Uncharacterized protein n=1 Tax=Rhodovarius crocodyli TaxID=1979269 RepID=A0A437MC47_9PROT|nr:hypothetical protein [Rhodovarius crocodyli]RVT95220.1 hypothetical protein EOD42_16680 [Rhodovarius crocodyli]
MSETKTEQKAAHTPGPWRIWQQVDPAIEQPSAHVALVNTTFVVGSGPLGAPEADARLIAAAPALLEACEAVFCAADMTDADRFLAMEKVATAIASSRGEG